MGVRARGGLRDEPTDAARVRQDVQPRGQDALPYPQVRVGSPPSSPPLPPLPTSMLELLRPATRNIHSRLAAWRGPSDKVAALTSAMSRPASARSLGASSSAAADDEPFQSVSASVETALAGIGRWASGWSAQDGERILDSAVSEASSFVPELHSPERVIDPAMSEVSSFIPELHSPELEEDSPSAPREQGSPRAGRPARTRAAAQRSLFVTEEECASAAAVGLGGTTPRVKDRRLRTTGRSPVPTDGQEVNEHDLLLLLSGWNEARKEEHLPHSDALPGYKFSNVGSIVAFDGTCV